MGYQRPDSVSEALSALAGGASVIAGGTDWYPARLGRPLPRDILDVTGLPGFAGIVREDGGWRIGAATTWSQVLRADLPPAFDGLKAAAREVGSVQIQNAGTVGGNLCNASPAADGMPPLLTLDAVVRVVGPEGRRDVPLAAFVTGVRQTDLGPGELVESLFIPDPGRAGSSFVKLGARKYLVISIVMVAAVVRIEAGRIAEARVAVGACSPVARRLTQLEAALQGRELAEISDLVTPEALSGLAPIADVRGSAEYRMEAVAELVRRAIADTAGEANG